MNSPPSILFALPWDLCAAGGVNRVVLSLARETARQGQLRPIVFCANPLLNTFQESEIGGIKVIRGRLSASMSGKRPGHNLVTFTHTLREELISWRQFLEQNNVRVVNAHYPGLNYSVFALLRKRRANFRLLFSMHGADLAALEASGLAVRPFLRWMLRKADRIVCCTDDLARRTQQAMKLDERQLVTIHNGIDIDALDRAKKDDYRPPIGEFDSYLVNATSYEHDKGQDVLLHAYTSLLRNGLKSALVLIGHSTAHLLQLRNLTRKLGLEDHVFFIPDLPHAQTLSAIRHARLLIHPARTEAFGKPLLEAGYLGTPIVATRTGGIPEALGGYYPYLAEPDDPAALAGAIDEALFNPTETRQQIKVMKRRVASSFTCGTTFSAYESTWSAGSS